jgi:hypothetical protein
MNFSGAIQPGAMLNIKRPGQAVCIEAQRACNRYGNGGIPIPSVVDSIFLSSRLEIPGRATAMRPLQAFRPPSQEAIFLFNTYNALLQMHTGTTSFV